MNVNLSCRFSARGRTNLLVIVMPLLMATLLAGCGGRTPRMPKAEGVIFAKPSDAVQKAAVDALVVTGFDVNKSEPLYVEGFRPRRLGLFVGSGGETVGVWLEPAESTRTRVRITTAKSFAGIAGQKNWNQVILEEMEKSLGKSE